MKDYSSDSTGIIWLRLIDSVLPVYVNQGCKMSFYLLLKLFFNYIIRITYLKYFVDYLLNVPSLIWNSFSNYRCIQLFWKAKKNVPQLQTLNLNTHKLLKHKQLTGAFYQQTNYFSNFRLTCTILYVFFVPVSSALQLLHYFFIYVQQDLWKRIYVLCNQFLLQFSTQIPAITQGTFLKTTIKG